MTPPTLPPHTRRSKATMIVQEPTCPKRGKQTNLPGWLAARHPFEKNRASYAKLPSRCAQQHLEDCWQPRHAMAPSLTVPMSSSPPGSVAHVFGPADGVRALGVCFRVGGWGSCGLRDLTGWVRSKLRKCMTNAKDFNLS